MASPVSLAAAGVGEVHEEFDMGPRFIQLQKDEETAWRRRCSAWFVNDSPRADHDSGKWRYALRDILPPHEVLAEEKVAAPAIAAIPTDAEESTPTIQSATVAEITAESTTETTSAEAGMAGVTLDPLLI
jgi:hypothetical protein